VQITPEELLAHAQGMALELRFKDQIIANQERENAQLLARVAELEQPPSEE
jgi:hypothetical protein